jgi:hypothetical protein
VLLLIADSVVNGAPASVIIGEPYTLGIPVKYLAPIVIGSVEFSFDGNIGFV